MKTKRQRVKVETQKAENKGHLTQNFKVIQSIWAKPIHNVYGILEALVQIDSCWGAEESTQTLVIDTPGTGSSCVTLSKLTNSEVQWSRVKGG